MAWRDAVGGFFATALAHQPGNAFAWDDFTSEPGDVDPVGLAGAYRAHLDRARGAAGADPHGHELLERWTTDQLYDLETARTWEDNPRFWVERHWHGVLALMDAAGRMRRRRVPRPWSQAFLARFPVLADTASAHLDRSRIGALDARHAVGRLKASQGLADSVAASTGGGPPGVVEAAHEASDRLAEWLAPACGNGALTSPLGPELWDAGMRVRTGVDLGADELEEALLDLIGRAAPRPGAPDADAPGAVPRTRDEYEALLRRIADRMPAPFTLGDAPPVRLDIGDDGPPGVTSAAFQSTVSRGGGPPVVYIRPSAYTHPGDVELDLVHECLPGHYWHHLAYQAAHSGHELCARHANPALDEGWARWCEHLWAQMSEDRAVRWRFGLRAAKYGAQALAALLVHARRAGIGQAARRIGALTGYPGDRAVSLTLSAYLDPWQAVAPAAGFLAFARRDERDGAEALHAAMARTGTIDLAEAVHG